MIEKVSLSCSSDRRSGSVCITESVSFIHPIFHFMSNPSPPSAGAWVTFGHAVDSSAKISASGTAVCTCSFKRRRNAIASRFSRPPNSFGSHSPFSRA